MLYIFEDSEAVIKMIIKRRSPTMRHVSRTRRVTIDWKLDNLDPEIQIKHVDAKNQLADTRTRSKFTRDEWNILRSASCPGAVSKRMQQATGGDNCGKVEADVEPGLELCGKLSYSAEVACILSSRDTEST